MEPQSPPAAVLRRARGRQDDPARQDTLHRRDEEERTEPSPSGHQPDTLSEALQSSVRMTNWTWGWLQQERVGMTQQLTVDLYYPDIRVAVDRGNENAEDVTLKQHLCAAHGIRYANMVAGELWAAFVSRLEDARVVHAGH